MAFAVPRLIARTQEKFNNVSSRSLASVSFPEDPLHSPTKQCRIGKTTPVLRVSTPAPAGLAVSGKETGYEDILPKFSEELRSIC